MERLRLKNALPHKLSAVLDAVEAFRQDVAARLLVPVEGRLPMFDPRRVPAELREAVSRFALAQDEFLDRSGLRLLPLDEAAQLRLRVTDLKKLGLLFDALPVGAFDSSEARTSPVYQALANVEAHLRETYSAETRFICDSAAARRKAQEAREACEAFGAAGVDGGILRRIVQHVDYWAGNKVDEYRYGAYRRWTLEQLRDERRETVFKVASERLRARAAEELEKVETAGTGPAVVALMRRELDAVDELCRQRGL